MSDPKLDALAETARNRGLKLIRSRVRTPGKRRFGRAGLTDAAGKPIFGMDAKGPVGTAEALEDFLRQLEAKDWNSSLGAAGGTEKQKTAASKHRAAENERPKPSFSPRPEPKPKLPIQPKPQIRNAILSDASQLARLIGELGSTIDARQVRRNLAALEKTGETPLVAVLGKAVVGLCGIGKRVAVHRPAPLGRITVLVVAEAAQGQGIGRKLVEAAEEWMRKRGCHLVEVTSNDRRTQAHAFYRHIGFERTGIRFAREL